MDCQNSPRLIKFYLKVQVDKVGKELECKFSVLFVSIFTNSVDCEQEVTERLEQLMRFGLVL